MAWSSHAAASMASTPSWLRDRGQLPGRLDRRSERREDRPARWNFALRDARRGASCACARARHRRHPPAEANLGILAISEMHAAIVALREFVPVVGVIAGRIGCFGGMGIAAGIVQRIDRCGNRPTRLDGPEVIEAGSRHPPNSMRATARACGQPIGCRRRRDDGGIDALVHNDDVAAIASAVRDSFRDPPKIWRSRRRRCGA